MGKKFLNRHFTTENTQMADKGIKRCLGLGVAQWQRAPQACLRPWVPSPAPKEKDLNTIGHWRHSGKVTVSCHHTPTTLALMRAAHPKG
jgi:hypothetical protein